MNNMRKLMLIAVTASAVSEAANNGDHFGEPVFTAAMAPRDVICPELPKLCTGHAMLHGQATTLTYLCAEKTKVPSTVHVTVTKTTTVTEADVTGSMTSFHAVPDSVEPTTTTILRSTTTQYKTITVSKVIPSLKISTSTPVDDKPLYTIQTSIPSSIPPKTSGSQYPTLSLPFTSGTNTGVFYSHSIHNSSLAAPTPYYPNSTTHSTYSTPTANFARQLEPAESSTTLGTNMAGQNGVSLYTLLFGVMMAALAV